jgi:imidazolonepropionase-like amidohydrolase
VISSALVRRALLAVCVAALVGCGPLRPSEPPSVAARKPPAWQAPLPPWQQADAEAAHEHTQSQGRPVLIRGARILIGDGRVIEEGHVLLEAGTIRAVGKGKGSAPANAEIVEAGGKVVTPGLIDSHSHIGVYPVPEAAAHSDGNEATAPVTSAVRSLDAFWPQDPSIDRALAGGVTTIQVLPGSANLIGGRSVTLKLRRAATARAMRFEGAPDGLKMACGENPKRVYGGRAQAPSTRMGSLAGQRTAFLEAARLMEDWKLWRASEGRRRNDLAKQRAELVRERKQRALRASWCEQARSPAKKRQCDGWKRGWAAQELEDPKDEPKLPPARNLAAETLAAALEGRLLIQVHCYRADDMARMLALSDEMGFQIRSFHHALEAYKLRRELVRRGIAVSTWADWWGFKLEAYDGIAENIALLETAGGRPIVHSDSEEGIQRLNQEAAKALWAGRHAGLDVDAERAIRWVTSNPAWALGIEQRAGSLEVGKDADLVVWSGDPLSVYTRAERVFIDGVMRWSDADKQRPASDFEAAP